MKPIVVFVFSVFLKYFNTTGRHRNSDKAKEWTIRGSNLGGGKRFSLHHTHQDWTCNPPSLLYNGYRGSFPKVKRPRRGVDHPRQSSTEGDNDYSCARRACHGGTLLSLLNLHI